MQLPRLLLTSILVLITPTLYAFTVVRDASQARVEKLVLFEKGQSADKLDFFAANENGFTLADDGTLQLRIDNNEPVEAGFRWAGNPDLPDAFSVSDYKYVLVTCRLEGATRTTYGNGTVNSRRPDNLWSALALFDEAGKNVAKAGMAEAAPGQKTPEETVTLAIPMLLFTYWGENPRPPIHGFGFQWGGSRPPSVRDFLLVIERVSLAN